MITDDSLREGMQAPGIAFKPSEKIDLAESISRCGIQRILFSYPSAHKSEFDALKQLCSKKIFKEVYGLGRAIRKDIDLIYATGANISLHFPFKYDSLDEVYDSVQYAVSLGRKVEISVVDITQYRIEMLMKIVNRLSELGVDTIQLPDTMGKATPRLVYNVVKEAKRQKNADIEVHCHNDRGLSIANAVSGMEAGADHIDATFLGIGERNGITDMLSISRLSEEYGMHTGLDLNKMENFARAFFDVIVEKAGKGFFASNLPNVGVNTGIHTAGTHAAFSQVFEGAQYSVNVYTGRSMLETILRNDHIDMGKENLLILMGKIKDRSASEGRVIGAAEVIQEAKLIAQSN